MTNPTPNTQTAPEGYVMNAKGHYVPLSAVKEIDKLRDDVVQDIISRAKELRSQMIGVKDIMFGNFHEFVELSAREYDTKIGGQKGNVSLLSFDGKYKVQMAVQDNIVFDERLQVTKSLIDECLNNGHKAQMTKSKPSSIMPLMWTRRVRLTPAECCRYAVLISMMRNGYKRWMPSRTPFKLPHLRSIYGFMSEMNTVNISKLALILPIYRVLKPP